MPIAVKALRDQPVVTEVDLGKALAPGASYVAALRATELARGAEAGRFPLPGGVRDEEPAQDDSCPKAS